MKRLIPYLLPLLLLSLAFGDRGQREDKTKSFEKPAVSEIENRLVELINQERLQRNLSPLKPSPELQALAIAHSQDKVEQNQVTHSSSNGKSYADRLAAERILSQEARENVGFSEAVEASPH